MVCEHLREFENIVRRSGAEETFRGHAWSKPNGEWVYYRCYIDKESAMARFNDEEIYEWSEHIGTHDGSEAGIVCKKCECGVMGLHPSCKSDAPVLTFI